MRRVYSRRVPVALFSHDLKAFCAAIIELYAGRAAQARTRSSLTALSAPQREEPPALPVEVMRWLPRPSFRTAFLIGGIAQGVFVARRRRALDEV